MNIYVNRDRIIATLALLPPSDYCHPQTIATLALLLPSDYCYPRTIATLALLPHSDYCHARKIAALGQMVHLGDRRFKQLMTNIRNSIYQFYTESKTEEIEIYTEN